MGGGGGGGLVFGNFVVCLWLCAKQATPKQQ
jgi:hypothetical protein